jgi:excisionase family DNA binding protein
LSFTSHNPGYQETPEWRLYYRSFNSIKSIMETYTFEQLPHAVSLLHEKLNKIERLLLERQEQQKQDDIFDTAQAAAFLNVSVATMYTKVCNQELPVNKRGKRLYFYKSELEEWIKGGRKRTADELRLEAQEHVNKGKKYRRY